MASQEPPRYEPGHPPHDPLNGMRAGGLIGGLLGGGAMLVLTSTNPLFLVVGAAAGAAAGYLTEKRRQPR